MQAFRDLEGLSYGNHAYADMAKSHAEGWVASNDISYIGSFLYVCEVLDLNSDWVRARFRRTKRRVQRKEPRGATARIRACDPAKLEGMTCLDIAGHFNTSKSVVYNVMTKFGIKYRYVRKGAGNYRKEIA